MKLFIQPKDGIMPVIRAIQRARKSLDILIFRFDRGDIEKALLNAVSRGVAVRALIAYTNRGGEKHLRDLEMRLLAEGVTVARTSDDLVRYHGKMMIVDREELLLLAFNFTSLDIEHSRSFGISTRNPALVREALRLFEADSHRQPYEAGLPGFVVSPVNARRELEAFLGKARTELTIYDPHVGDPAMIRLLDERARAGVKVRIIGKLTRKNANIAVERMPGIRLHTRVVCRDGEWVFLGSQSLRGTELDLRREVGVIFRNAEIVKEILRTFEEDWAAAQVAKSVVKEPAPPAAKVAKKVAKVMTKALPPVAPALEVAVKEVVGREVDVPMNPEELEETVKDAVIQAVKEVVRDVVEEAVEAEEEETAEPVTSR